MFIFLTTLKYHSNKFLELKPKDEVTLRSPGVLFCLILVCSKLQFFPIHFYWCPFTNTRLRSFFFHPLNIVELSQKKNVCVQEANLGKVTKSCTTQIKGIIC